MFTEHIYRRILLKSINWYIKAFKIMLPKSELSPLMSTYQVDVLVDYIKTILFKFARRNE